MTPIELWHHQLMMAAARMAAAVRTEDPDTVAAVLATELARRPPPGGVDVVTGLLLALSIQVPDDVPLRQRVAWSLDIDQPPPPAPGQLDRPPRLGRIPPPRISPPRIPLARIRPGRMSTPPAPLPTAAPAVGG
jgi:hypothetical protein